MQPAPDIDGAMTGWKPPHQEVCAGGPIPIPTPVNGHAAHILEPFTAFYVGAGKIHTFLQYDDRLGLQSVSAPNGDRVRSPIPKP